MIRTQIRRLAAALLAATGSPHPTSHPEYLQEKAYIGALSSSAASPRWPSPRALDPPTGSGRPER